MKANVVVKKEVDIKKVVVDFCPRYTDEEESSFYHGNEKLPFFDGERFKIEFDPDTGVVIGWPEGRPVDIFEKICDEGTYTLLDENDEEIASIHQDYVPCIVPNEYGDYIALKIDDTGKLSNFVKDADISDFFPSED